MNPKWYVFVIIFTFLTVVLRTRSFAEPARREPRRKLRWGYSEPLRTPTAAHGCAAGACALGAGGARPNQLLLDGAGLATTRPTGTGTMTRARMMSPAYPLQMARRMFSSIAGISWAKIERWTRALVPRTLALGKVGLMSKPVDTDILAWVFTDCSHLDDPDCHAFGRLGHLW